MGERATPVVDDWNGDGKKDLLTGNMDGNIIVYINEGTDSSPVFGTPYLLQVDGRDFDIGSRSAPRIADWNKDGLKDILVGEMEGHVYYLKNTGTNSAPVFDDYDKLFLGNGDILKNPDSAGRPGSRLFVADWNNDGVDDMLVGGKNGKIILYTGALKPSYSVGVLANMISTQLSERIAKFKKQSKNTIKEIRKGIL